MSTPRAVFFGTSSFAIPILDATASVADVVAVVTQPAQPAGRGGRVTPSAIETAARNHALKVYTPSRLTPDVIATIAALTPDVAVLAAYGKIIPASLLTVPRHGFVNVHPSLLPKYRGAAPVAGALLDNLTETGTTIIKLDDELDHGPVIAQSSLPIEPHEHRPALEQRLAALGATLLSASLPQYLRGAVTPTPQKHHLASYTRPFSREQASIVWSDDAARIERDIRAYDPWPGTVTTWDGALLKILDGVAIRYREPKREQPGTVIRYDGHPCVVCGVDVLRLTTVQPANGKRMDARAFAHGRPAFIGSVLGR